MPHSPAIADTYSLLVLNVNFRNFLSLSYDCRCTTVDDFVPLFEKYGKIVDIFIPRDRRTGESRGFAFVRYLYKDEAQKAVNRLDGMLVDGREIAVQFAKYGPNSERIREGRIVEKFPQGRVRSRSRSPSRRYRDDYYGERDYRRRNHSRSLDRNERERYYEEERDYQYGNRGYSPDYGRERDRR
ncbi:serine/arginine-rich splicing factor sc35 [Phtheirospermum japonicum]|uniref:Serine/arginine-rich splicing factor sc35 n=1 Tax=Phtheirospermum japonicum TaxID=374723 RepID=A0A830CHF1_9LAMI|nr:serine/arginine-rich splicing factor sc35 [Phtheirospermum japonicum]